MIGAPRRTRRGASARCGRRSGSPAPGAAGRVAGIGQPAGDVGVGRPHPPLRRRCARRTRTGWPRPAAAGPGSCACAGGAGDGGRGRVTRFAPDAQLRGFASITEHPGGESAAGGAEASGQAPRGWGLSRPPSWSRSGLPPRGVGPLPGGATGAAPPCSACGALHQKKSPCASWPPGRRAPLRAGPAAGPGSPWPTPSASPPHPPAAVRLPWRWGATGAAEVLDLYLTAPLAPHDRRPHRGPACPRGARVVRGAGGAPAGPRPVAALLHWAECRCGR